MDTLLKKVQEIEKTAEQMIADTRQSHTDELRDLQSREESVLAETRKKAQERGSKILAEQLSKAEQEINTIKQQGEQSAKMVHDAANKNRPTALKLANKLFADEYIS